MVLPTPEPFVADLCSRPVAFEIRRWVESLPDGPHVSANQDGVSRLSPLTLDTIPEPDAVQPWEFPARPLLERLLSRREVLTWFAFRQRAGKEVEEMIKAKGFLVNDQWADRTAVAFNLFPWEVWGDQWLNLPPTLEAVACAARLEPRFLKLALSNRWKRCFVPKPLKSLPGPLLKSPNQKTQVYFPREALDWAEDFRRSGAKITDESFVSARKRTAQQ